VKFPQALAGLLQWCGSLPVQRAAADFLSHAMATPRRRALEYLYQHGIRSPEVIEQMRIG
jgi:hypothetical protein